ncbi:hypothetical protein F4782DRAFT_546532 [Xylaria castorea]|nr:hypothetical protein F4782DRAFT_546532 [Xylaria castorea]
MTVLSVEAIVAIISLLVNLPPTILVLHQYTKRYRQARQGEALPHTTAQLRPLCDLYGQHTHATNIVPNGGPAYGFIEEQYSLSQTVTFRLASPYHRPP